MLNERDKSQAKIQLTKTLCHMQRMNAVEMAKETQSIASTVNNNEAEVDNDLDPIELLLMEREKETERRRENILPGNEVISVHDVDKLLEEFFIEPRIDKKNCALQYWEQRKHTSPYLYVLSSVVLALPVTQVSCERAFSGLKFILSDLRSQLSNDVLEDILIIRANHKFMNK